MNTQGPECAESDSQIDKAKKVRSVLTSSLWTLKCKVAMAGALFS